jgi:hypothetical protein
MTSSHAFRSFAFAYGTAFAVFYVVALKLDLALFTVYPSIGVVLLGTHHARDVVDPRWVFAPAMYWYGWTATAALSALVRSYCCVVARTMDTKVLAGVVVGGSRARDVRVRLPHTAMVSTLARTGVIRQVTSDFLAPQVS